ncbi:engulfment and cell motility protein 3 [Anopheles sinensis]|uniref:Engulfment and cell motility protein 3 n=1 Tax=Anopheles sinensis TaxID=74873 RepID=A0A084WQ29_ANOSI|nr:engulfment and cell motility protein 3 [Anopheles sinensis]
MTKPIPLLQERTRVLEPIVRQHILRLCKGALFPSAAKRGTGNVASTSPCKANAWGPVLPLHKVTLAIDEATGNCAANGDRSADWHTGGAL